MVKRLIIIFLLLPTALFAINPRYYTLLIALDGFRHDYPGRGLTPNIDCIIAKGVKATSLVPVFPTTTSPNIISSLSGLLPVNHGIISNNFLNRPANRIYNGDDTVSGRARKWVSGEMIWETAAKFKIKTASCYMPLVETLNTSSMPDYIEKYDGSITVQQRIDKVADLLKLPFAIRPEFIMLFIEEADAAGHRFGTKSEETDKAIMHIDYFIGNILDSLRTLGLEDSVNIILYSTHGMADIDSYQPVVPTGPSAQLFNFGAYILIYSQETSELYRKLKEAENHYKAFLTEEIPGHLCFRNSSCLPQVLVLAEPGWVLCPDTSMNYKELRGIHGYDNYCLDMQGIFCASGPSFKDHLETGSINILDINPLICRILNILPNNTIDGKLERVEYLFREK